MAQGLRCFAGASSHTSGWATGAHRPSLGAQTRTPTRLLRSLVKQKGQAALPLVELPEPITAVAGLQFVPSLQVRSSADMQHGLAPEHSSGSSWP